MCASVRGHVRRGVACGWTRTLRMKGMFVLTPRMRVSMSARSSFSAADLKSRAEPVTLISIARASQGRVRACMCTGVYTCMHAMHVTFISIES